MSSCTGDASAANSATTLPIGPDRFDRESREAQYHIPHAVLFVTEVDHVPRMAPRWSRRCRRGGSGQTTMVLNMTEADTGGGAVTCEVSAGSIRPESVSLVAAMLLADIQRASSSGHTGSVRPGTLPRSAACLAFLVVWLCPCPTSSCYVRFHLDGGFPGSLAARSPRPKRQRTAEAVERFLKGAATMFVTG